MIHGHSSLKYATNQINHPLGSLKWLLSLITLNVDQKPLNSVRSFDLNVSLVFFYSLMTGFII